jgi:hypothetical protein
MSSSFSPPSLFSSTPGSAAEYDDARFLCDRLRSESADPFPRVQELSSILHRLLETPITMELLQSTKVGLLVSSLKKQFPIQLSNIAKELINRWKFLVNQKLGTIQIQANSAVNSTAQPANKPENKQSQSVKAVPTSAPGTKQLASNTKVPTCSSIQLTNQSKSQLIKNQTKKQKIQEIQTIKANPSVLTLNQRKRPANETAEFPAPKKPNPTLTEKEVSSLFEEEVLESSESLAEQQIPLYNPNAHVFEHAISDHSNQFTNKFHSSGIIHLCSLKQMCVDFIQLHLTQFTHFEALPSRLVPLIFSKASAAQLRLIESNNPHLLSDTDILWRNLAMRNFPDFKGLKPANLTSWSAVYQNLEAEKRAKLNSVGEKMRAKQAAAAMSKEANSVKSIDVNTAVKTLAKTPGTKISIPKLPQPLGSGRLAAIRSDSAKAHKSVWNAKSF